MHASDYRRRRAYPAQRLTESLLVACLATIVPVTFALATTGDDQAMSELMSMDLSELVSMPVVTASRSEMRVGEAPATIYAFSREIIRQRGYFYLHELLEDVPEIQHNAKSATEAGNNFSLRGVSGNEKLIVLLDGARVSSATGTPHSISTNYSLANAKRVEVMLGPASALYGADAFSGVVNIITRTGDEIEGIEAKGSYGRWATTSDSLVGGVKIDEIFGWRPENFSISFMGDVYLSDEPKFPSYYPDDYAWWLNEYSQGGQLGLLGTNATVSVTPQPWKTPSRSYSIHTRVLLEDFEASLFRARESHNDSISGDPKFNVFVADAKFITTLEEYLLRHDHTTKDERWNFKTTGSFNRYTLEPDSRFINVFVNYAEGFKFETNWEARIEEQATVKFNDDISLIFGGSTAFINALPKTGDLPSKYDKDLSPSAQQFLYNFGTNISQDIFKINYETYGLFGQILWNVTEQWHLIAGYRFGYDSRFRDSHNPRAGIVWKPTKNVALKLLYGEAYLAPSPYKSHSHFGSFLTGADNIINAETTASFFFRLTNPDLKPEKLRSLELAGSWKLSPNLHLSADAYYTRVEDLITTNQTFGERFKGWEVLIVERLINKGTLSIGGVTGKIKFSKKLGDVSTLTWFSYGFMDGDLAGGPITNHAMHTWKGGIDLVWRELSASTRFLGRSSTHHPIKDARVAGATIVNFFARYHPRWAERGGKWGAWVKINNLLDERYRSVTQGSDEALVGQPMDPIRFLFGISWEIGLRDASKAE